MTNKTFLYEGVIQLFGEVESPHFMPWIIDYAKKLGIKIKRDFCEKNQLTLHVIGEREMLVCLSIACSLGPKSVLVNKVENEFIPLNVC